MCLALGSELGSHNPALVELAALCLGARCQPLSGGGFKAVGVGFRERSVSVQGSGQRSCVVRPQL